MDLGSSHTDPWAPAWSHESALHLDDDLESPPPKPQRPTPPGESSQKARPQRSEKLSDDGNCRTSRPQRSEKLTDDGSRTSRVRGPAEVKTARDTEADDEGLPEGAQGADFKTLQAMIARGIQDAESGASKIEKDIVPTRLGGEDEEELRYRERQRLKRDQEASQREKERDHARQKRRREQEDRDRRQAEEMDREEREELSHREARTHAEAQCRREFKSAVRIQARVRGRRQRAGQPSLVPHNLKGVVHWEPHMSTGVHPC